MIQNDKVDWEKKQSAKKGLHEESLILQIVSLRNVRNDGCLDYIIFWECQHFYLDIKMYFIFFRAGFLSDQSAY